MGLGCYYAVLAGIVVLTGQKAGAGVEVRDMSPQVLSVHGADDPLTRILTLRCPAPWPEAITISQTARKGEVLVWIVPNGVSQTQDEISYDVEVTFPAKGEWMVHLWAPASPGAESREIWSERLRIE